jgi:hypothetical protein
MTPATPVEATQRRANGQRGACLMRRGKRDGFLPLPVRLAFNRLTAWKRLASARSRQWRRWG